MGDGVPEVVEGASGGLSQSALELGEGVLDRVEVGGIWGQVEETCAARLDGLADAVEDVLATLTKRGDLAISGWTVPLHNTRLGYAHPDLTVRTAWGDALSYSLCPAQG